MKFLSDSSNFPYSKPSAYQKVNYELELLLDISRLEMSIGTIRQNMLAVGSSYSTDPRGPSTDPTDPWRTPIFPGNIRTPHYFLKAVLKLSWCCCKTACLLLQNSWGPSQQSKIRTPDFIFSKISNICVTLYFMTHYYTLVWFTGNYIHVKVYNFGHFISWQYVVSFVVESPQCPGISLHLIHI